MYPGNKEDAERLKIRKGEDDSIFGGKQGREIDQGYIQKVDFSKGPLLHQKVKEEREVYVGGIKRKGEKSI